MRFKGAVLCYDSGWGQLYVHDGAETKYFSPGSFPMPLESGLQVEITGTTTFAENDPALTNLHVVVEGHAALPFGPTRAGYSGPRPEVPCLRAGRPAG